MFPNSPFAHDIGSFRTPVEPPDSEPDSGSLSSISINCDWLPLIRGALTQLLLQSTWKTDIVSLETTQKRAWRLINMFAENDCDMCDCLEFTNGMWQKGTPDGHGGTVFTPVDPRTEGTVPGAWPTPPSGQTGNCLAGANIRQAFFDYNQAIIAQLGIEASLFLLAQVGVTFVEFAIPVIGIISNIALNLASAAQDAGTALMIATVGPTEHLDAYHELQCAVSCNSDADGHISATQFNLIKTQIADEIPALISNTTERALWIATVDAFLDMYGPNGLSILANKLNVNTGDCSDCNCEWESLFDFTAFDYASIIEVLDGVWVAGHGYRGVFDTDHFYSEIRVTFSPHANITKYEMQYSVSYVGGSNTLKAVTYYPESGDIRFGSLVNGDHQTAGFTALHSDCTYLYGVLVSDGTPMLDIEKWLIRGNGTKPAGWP